MSASLLFGNGFNRVFNVANNSVSWDDLLAEIKGFNHFESKDLPNTLTYERIVIEGGEKNISLSEEHTKNLIADKFSLQGTNALYAKIIDLGLNNYLTTNYDLAFELAIQSPSVFENNSEELYSIRRKKEYNIDERTASIWHVHGDINNPKSIMLGLDHYCGSIGKIDAYIKGTYTYSIAGENKRVDGISQKIKNNSFDGVSWVELFFKEDIHIVGLSLDYSETDLWWILARRARMQKNGISIRNKIFFHCGSSDCPQKIGTLKSLNVVVIQYDAACGYESMYRQIIANIDSIECQSRSRHSATIISEPQVSDFSSADHILSAKKAVESPEEFMG
ncbi:MULTISPECIES: SIR2 family protein [Pseudomonas]|uniref:SIR2-like domain-containing protein n=3 Tax=Pseudomonas lactis TaxID=1615674 RepID=A0ABS9FTD9_9PSED|nr:MULTISPECIES: SIR2 family protein [Pseudomonas]MBI6976164.1 SIR2 family protein [Pseudomonas lactis]MCF4972255.1 hypothetical protein [Pseudomonas lactis]MCF5001998.1 hypothetical protein [Pseudomonas lactis]MCF5008337.1 hypothetical protein [Pseudomonas lactis]MCF5015899.1 hypothetical protein [Pseudomonas lactis]